MTVSLLALLCGSSFLVALVTCHVMRVVAERHGLLDRANERSLHTTPVPRLGGVGIVLGVSGASVVALALSPSWDRTTLAWLVAALLLAGLGLADDLRGLGAGVRFLSQIGLAGGFALTVGAPTRLAITTDVIVSLPPWASLSLWTVFIVGTLNIYNFMDGMDGLAALQAVGAGMAVAAGLRTGAHGTLAIVPLTLAAAALGFSIHNAPPAKIFMGDAGSTFIGFTFAGLALAGAASPEPLPVLTVPVALAPFLLDGTYTILRRLSRGEKIWRAHRSHLYQRAVATGLSHHDVLVRYAAWIVCSAVASVIVATSGWRAAAAGVAVVLGGLAVAVSWVRRIERTSGISPERGHGGLPHR